MSHAMTYKHMSHTKCESSRRKKHFPARTTTGYINPTQTQVLKSISETVYSSSYPKPINLSTSLHSEAFSPSQPTPTQKNPNPNPNLITPGLGLIFVIFFTISFFV